MKEREDFSRRSFLKVCGCSPLLGAPLPGGQDSYELVVDDFDRPDSPGIGDGWESFNPGYWKIQGRALRRRLKNVGDGNPVLWFPWHWETHRHKEIPLDRDLSLPYGMMWRRDWKMQGNYTIQIEVEIKALPPSSREIPDWRQHQAGYALAGICFGGASLHETWSAAGNEADLQLYQYEDLAEKTCWFAAWRDNGTFGLYDHASDLPEPLDKHLEVAVSRPEAGDRVTIQLEVSGGESEPAQVMATFFRNGEKTQVLIRNVDRAKYSDGYFGLVARGLLDFEVKEVILHPAKNESLLVPLNELHVCYPLADTLRQEDGIWKCKFVALFRNEGQQAEVKLAETPLSQAGWAQLGTAGTAAIISNDFRCNTAVIEVTLPASPADKALYYTVWKDGRDVTRDPRSGFLRKKDYLGRLPRLKAPYRLCGLSCHSIVGNSPNLLDSEKFRENWIHDQPEPDAYRHLEDYDFQVMLWEDDVWYLETVFPPPSTDDAYKVITTALAGPTTRWQMMRHWNVLNPGDHDLGMDDVKGPEQILLRRDPDLGQDPDYMRRNFQIVAHLMSGEENPSPSENPRRWRRWKMPDEDFSLLILDARLWRSSQDTRIWDDEGWEHRRNPYDRTDVTRTLLGEEQFAWLQQIIRTDSAPAICVTGVNALHPIWAGYLKDPETGLRWNQRDRVAADYAGWVKAGADRVIELLGSRDGIVTVYGDVHNGCILKNIQQRLYECAFGPIGTYGGRRVKEGFGPKMSDYDGRELEILALYHSRYESPTLKPIQGPKYWNFLEMHFDPRGPEPEFVLKIRNLIDPPGEAARGGGFVAEQISETGRPPASRLPSLTTLPAANVLLLHPDGQPIRGTRSLEDGSLPLGGLIDIPPSSPIVVQAVSGTRAKVQVTETLPL